MTTSQVVDSYCHWFFRVALELVSPLQVIHLPRVESFTPLGVDTR